MTDDEQPGLIRPVLRGFVAGVGLLTIYLLHRFVRPYWYAVRIEHWLQVERDYIQDFERTVHPLGFYEYEVFLTEGDEPDLYIENKRRRVPVIIRGEHAFDRDVVSNLVKRDLQEGTKRFEDQRKFFEEVQWAVQMAPGVGNFVDHQGEPCESDEAEGVIVEYRIYPDTVSQHEILNSIVEIANTFRTIRQREEKYLNRLDDGR